MTLDDITIIITTYKSNKKVKLCLDSIQGKCKVIIIENSKDQKLKESVEKNYKNVECIIPFENLGYGKANNLALKKVTTKYSLILNPDTNLSNNALEKFSNIVKFIPEGIPGEPGVKLGDPVVHIQAESALHGK